MRFRTWSLLLLVIWPGAMAVAAEDDGAAALDQQIEAARQKLDEAARQLAELHKQMWAREPKPPAPPHWPKSDRPMLGVLVDQKGDADGLVLVGITPEGGAEQAGLKAGDRLVAINGVALDAGAERKPLALLAEVLGQATPGEPVTVAFVRDGERQEVSVVTQTRGSFMEDMLEKEITILEPMEAFRHMQSLEHLKMLEPEEMMAHLKALEDIDSPFAPRDVIRVPAGLELRDVDATLGYYFGVDGGVLVLAVSEDDGGLQPGDILLDIGGDPVVNADQALGALGAAEGDIEVSVRRRGRTRDLDLDGARLNANQAVQLQSGARRIVIRRSGDGKDVRVEVKPGD
jgi:predicted metalloprotease with PDZ domain